MSIQESNVVDLHPDRFEEFWKNYPKRVGKPIAKAKFDQITREGLKTRTLDRDSGTYVDIELRATPEEIIEAAKRYRESLIDKSTYTFKIEKQFIPMPSTWLNQGRFHDEF